MKERPILFNSEMVTAILDGRKTQTRRVIKGHELKMIQFNAFDNPTSQCPYGVIGDRLWVRETWAETTFIKVARTNEWEWKEKDGQRNSKGILGNYSLCALYKTFNLSCPVGKWSPSIHMPRWASRITLEITAIRAERVQEISERDCVREGIKASACWEDIGNDVKELRCPEWAFEKLWNSIHKDKNTWKDNPWVWAISFKKI